MKVRRCLKISKVLKILVIIVLEPVQLQTQEAGATLGEDRGQTLVTVYEEQVSVGELQVLKIR